MPGIVSFEALHGDQPTIVTSNADKEKYCLEDLYIIIRHGAHLLLLKSSMHKDVSLAKVDI